MQLVGRKEGGKEIICVCSCLAAQGFAHFCCTCSAVMAVGDISLGHTRCKCVADCRDLFIIVDNPDGMLYPIISDKIVYRLIFLFPVVNDVIYCAYVSVSQEDITCLCFCCLYMIDPVLFFFRTGEFMFFYDVIFIVVHT